MEWKSQISELFIKLKNFKLYCWIVANNVLKIITINDVVTKCQMSFQIWYVGNKSTNKLSKLPKVAKMSNSMSMWVVQLRTHILLMKYTHSVTYKVSVLIK